MTQFEFLHILTKFVEFKTQRELMWMDIALLRGLRRRIIARRTYRRRQVINQFYQELWYESKNRRLPRKAEAFQEMGVSKDTQIDRLRRALAKAIVDQDFRLAAEIRDKIKSYENSRENKRNPPV